MACNNSRWKAANQSERLKDKKKKNRKKNQSQC